ncbi:cytochrome P450 CYP749A22-like [Pyrus ussuriensis x Pyrus communis]|uniref:Cytochrome P450 CYP749A22-like n=1 Tax=Pyrus ussuriensis x Pyrus communis TaxID=2448454 RepID=A0A5N5HDC5_9ROSA|nr:cytochrome P450 CYP749A22-like [Pyrus ussuriensis x Pyrus communis]
MKSLGGLEIILSSLLCLLLLLALIKIFHKLWWSPIRLQNLVAMQGIKGPSYRFVHGNTKEISSMQEEAMSRPKSLSHDIFSRVQPHIHLWTKTYGANFLQWYGSQAQLVITEPELCKEILTNKDRAYPKSEPKSFLRRLLGDGLVVSDGEKWAKMRKLANYAFHGEILKGMAPTVIASAETMLETWKEHDGQEIDVFEEFRLYTSEVISKTAFGSSYLEGKNIFEILDKLGHLSFKNAFKLRFPGISTFIKSNDEIESAKLEKSIRDSIMEMIKNRENKAMAGEEDSFGNDFLGVLLKAHQDTDERKRISIDEIVDECKTFYFAGQETTNSALAWTVFLLAIHTDWQEDARKEVIQIFGKQNPNLDGIAKLKTMSMIFNESLRLYPPVVTIERKIGREVKLGKHVLPANVEITIPCLALQHEPQIWGEDVLLFKPERFSEGVAKATKNNIAAFLPWGLGPRSCVGSNFAAIETKIVLSMILQRFSFTLSPAYIHSPYRLLTVRPQHGVQVMLHSLT